MEETRNLIIVGFIEVLGRLDSESHLWIVRRGLLAYLSFRLNFLFIVHAGYVTAKNN